MVLRLPDSWLNWNLDMLVSGERRKSTVVSYLMQVVHAKKEITINAHALGRVEWIKS